MMWPTICIDDFFTNPKEILDYAKTLEYTPSADGTWPGARSKPLHQLDNNFFSHVTGKMLAALYPNEWRELSWHADSYFQKIDSRWKGQGWVHKDVGKEISSIIYLSDNVDCGTSLYKQITYKSLPLENNKTNYNLNPETMKSNKYKKDLMEHNKDYRKTVSFKSEFNRCIMFDSYQYHAVDDFNKDDSKERITIITFFDSITRSNRTAVKPHAGESRRL